MDLKIEECLSHVIRVIIRRGELVVEGNEGRIGTFFITIISQCGKLPSLTEASWGKEL